MENISVVSDYRGTVKAIVNVLNRKPLSHSVVGLDCENVSGPGYKGPIVPATLQLANSNGFCGIFQLYVAKELQDRENNTNCYSRMLPRVESILSEILEDSTILKVGVNVIEDSEYLQKHYGLICKGCLDIRHVANEVGIEPRSLEHIAEDVLEERKIRLKKKIPWQSEELPQKQIEYAAKDALLGVQIFMKLNKKRLDKLSGDGTFWQRTVKHWEKYIGKKFVFKPVEEINSNETWVKQISTLSRSPEACAIQFESALSIRGKFCVVCGEDGYFTIRRKAIVPVDYNVPTSVNLDPHLDMCKECVDKSQEEDYTLREELTDKCGAPYPDYNNEKLTKAKEIVQEILFEKGDRDYVLYQKSKLCQLLGISVRELDSQILATITTMDCWPGTAHGEFVHQYFEHFYTDGEDRLRWIWCERFITTMKPKNLPTSWVLYYRQKWSLYRTWQI